MDVRQEQECDVRGALPSALTLSFPIARATAQRQNWVQVYGTPNGEWQRSPMTYAIGGSNTSRCQSPARDTAVRFSCLAWQHDGAPSSLGGMRAGDIR